jgi:hypothetical protein
VSEATVLKASEHLDACIAPATEAVKEQLRASEVLHVDVMCQHFSGHSLSLVFNACS